MTINEHTIVEFIKRNLDYSNFPGTQLVSFKKLTDQGKDIAAAKEYCEVTGSSLEEAHLAVFAAKNL